MKQNRVHQPLLLTLVPLLFLSIISPAFAQSTCGDIISEEYQYGEMPEDDGFVEIRTPIEDCDNPFNADTPEPFTYDLMLENQTVTSGSVVVIEEAETNLSGTFAINKPPALSVKNIDIFQKDGEDYRLVAQSSFNNFNILDVVSGEYVAVLTYYELSFNQTKPWWQRALEKVFGVMSTYAYYPDFNEVVAIPFSIEVETLTPLGASSVLFLPGIKASRLYTEENGQENQLWNPNNDTDVLKLRMDTNSASINNVYTNDVIASVGIFNFYKDFLSELETLKEGGAIKDFTPFAYDWRYSVFEVASEDIALQNGESKNLKEEVERLAAESYTGKVTLIGHSNGGLVAKALLHLYGDTELAGKVDKIIMIGTPQLGTPLAIGSLLHGYKESLGFGLITTDEATREAVHNMPGAYGLLPTSRYFDVTGNELVVTTDDSALTAPISTYGDITNSTQLKSFLTDSLSTFSVVEGTKDPLPLNENLLESTLENQEILDNWNAPNGVEVYEVVGTGIVTIKGFEYRALGCAGLVTCFVPSQVKPFPIPTNYGDGVVVGNSAEGYDGSKNTYFIDLKEAGSGLARNFDHADLTESESVQDFVISAIKYPYLTNTLVSDEFSSIATRYTIAGVHSPVTIRAVTSKGKVGIFNNQIFEEVPGSKYFTLGESTYLVLPSDEEYSMEIIGTRDGVFALTIDQLLENNSIDALSYLPAATTTSTMVSTFTLDNRDISNLSTDYENDGVIDLVQTPDGEIIPPEQPVATTYPDLKNAINELKLKRGFKTALLVQAKLAEKFSYSEKRVFKKLEQRTLESLLKTLKVYNKKKLITDEELANLKNIIKALTI